MRSNRRLFLQQAAGFGALALDRTAKVDQLMEKFQDPVVGIDAHCWVYASAFPPDWDATPILDRIFGEIKGAGYDRVELMESIIRHENSVARLRTLIHQYHLPVGGCSYYGDFWDLAQQPKLLDDVKTVIDRLQQLGATMIGLTVGDAERKKTHQELDVQADGLQKVIDFCKGTSVIPNLHNHTFEVKDQLYDLHATLQRLPDIKLGPDLNWLVRAGVDPVWFIEKYGGQMVYMHLRDQDRQGKWTEALGEGVIDFNSIALALKKMKYRGRAAVELALDNPPTRPLAEDWLISRRYVKTIFNW